MRARSAFLLLLALTLHDGAALAKRVGYLHLGLHGVGNVHLGDGPQAGWTGGLGLHLTGGLYDGGSTLGVGAFTHVQFVGAVDHWRVSFGLQPHWTVAGLEIGASWEQGSGPTSSTWGLHLMPFASLGGLVALGVRINVPLEQGPDRYGIDIGLVLAIGFPFEGLWGGWSRNVPVVH